MAGSAVKQLFTAKQITERQFELIKSKLPQFGLWTQKLINRETLKRRILNEKLTKKLFKICVKNAKDFKDNSLIELMIQKTNEVSFLQELTADHYGKSIRNRAKEKIKIVKNLGKIDFKSQE